MGQRGPAPKPIAGQIKSGTYRADRHGFSTLDCEVPAMPGNLTPKAQAFWNVVSREAEKAGYITSVDGKLLAMMADSWSLYCEAMDSIEKHGILVEKPGQYGTDLKSNPALKDRATLWKQMYDGLRQFGLSPSARVGMTSMQAQGKSDEEAEVAKILGIGG